MLKLNNSRKLKVLEFVIFHVGICLYIALIFMCLILIPCAGKNLSRRQRGGQGDVDALRWHCLILR